MKKALFILLFFLSASLTKAQQTEYLFGGDGWRVGGFGGPIFQFASVGDQFAFYNGGGGGAIFNGKFFLGGYGMGLSTSHDVDPSRLNILFPLPSHRYELDFGHGGLWLGYNFRPNEKFHFSLSSTLGGGGYSIERYNGDAFEAEIVNGSAFVISPSVGAEINIIPWFKIAAMAGYQYVAAESNHNWANDLSSPMLQLQLKFGYFAEN